MAVTYTDEDSGRHNPSPFVFQAPHGLTAGTANFQNGTVLGDFRIPGGSGRGHTARVLGRRGCGVTENSPPPDHVDIRERAGRLPMRVIEFFCGAGGTGLGLKRAGFDTILSVDKWPPAVATYQKNVGGQARVIDMQRLFLFLADGVEYGRPQLIAGSPPCQDFSKVGSRKEGQNAKLTQFFSMFIAIARPEWILIENVPEAAKSRIWKRTRDALKRYGYGLTETVLNAAFYGVPQNRKRLIVVGRLGEQDGFLVSALADAATAKPMPVRAMLRPEIPEDRALLDSTYFYMRPYTGGRGVRSIDEPSPTIIRTATDGPGPTYLANPHPRDPIPAAQAHVLSQSQVSRIQGFPVEWDWSPIGNNKKDISQAIANAVPAGLAEAVGRVILARHNGETIPAVEDGFAEWLCRGGKSERTASNVKASLNRARRFLGGRTFADPALDFGRLETAEGFDALSTQTKSDLRSALRLHAEWQAGTR